MKRFIFIIVIILITISLPGCAKKSDNKVYNYESREIEELFVKKEIKSLGVKDNTEGRISGSMSGFSIGYGYMSGSVNGKTEEKTYYYVYVKETEDKYLLKKYDATTTYISESKDGAYLEEKVKSFVMDKDALRDPMVKIDGMTAWWPLLESGCIVNDIKYDIVNLELLESSTRDRLISILPELKEEGKILLISTRGNDFTLFVPEGTIVTEYNADVQNVD